MERCHTYAECKETKAALAQLQGVVKEHEDRCQEFANKVFERDKAIGVVKAKLFESDMTIAEQVKKRAALEADLTQSKLEWKELEKLYDESQENLRREHLNYLDEVATVAKRDEAIKVAVEDLNEIKAVDMIANCFAVVDRIKRSTSRLEVAAKEDR